MKACSALAVFSLVSLSGCTTTEPPAAGANRADIVAAVTALDERWSEAATRGDVDAALACFHPTDGFGFVYDGGTVTNFADFEELTRRSYESRASLATTNLERRVLVVNPEVAMLTGTSLAVWTGHDGSVFEIDLQYGLLCSRVVGAWKIVHAYEFTAR